MSLEVIAAIAYGLLAIIGGIVGYTKAKSQTSLISGIVSGIILLIGGVAQQQGMAWGLPLTAIVSLVLVVVFTVRFAKTRKFMPAGLMILAGVATLAILLV